MKFYAQLKDSDIVLQYTQDEDTARIFGYKTELDYQPIHYDGLLYTREGFEKIKTTDEYKEEQKAIIKCGFETEAKQMENDALYIEYKGHKISLDEILFKSLFYSSVTDLFVYLRAEDKTIFKMTRTSFLLLIAKAKANLKATEEALYNAEQNYDPTKTLEKSIQSLKSVLNSIDKIFND